MITRRMITTTGPTPLLYRSYNERRSSHQNDSLGIELICDVKHRKHHLRVQKVGIFGFLAVFLLYWAGSKHSEFGSNRNIDSDYKHWDDRFASWEEWKHRKVLSTLGENHLASQLQLASIAPNLWDPFEKDPSQYEKIIQSNFAQWSNRGNRIDKSMWDLMIAELNISSWFANIHKTDESLAWWNATRSFLEDQKKQTKQEIISFNTERGFQMLNSKFAAPLVFRYQQGWDSQVNEAYSAVASIAAVLNSMRGSILRDDFPYITQSHLMANKCLQQKVTHTQESSMPALFAGMGLQQTQDVLECLLTGQKSEVEVYPTRHFPTDQSDTQKGILTFVKSFRQTLLQGLSEGNRLMINYDRSILGQEGHGHWSPLVAYNSASNSWLILDVNKYGFDPVWVTTETLFRSVATADSCGRFSYPQRKLDLGKSHAELALELNCEQSDRGLIVIKKSR